MTHFKGHQAEYRALIDAISKAPTTDLTSHRAVLKEIEVQPTTPAIVEVTPIDFYFVLVHAEDEASLASSNAMCDEGCVLEKLGNGWYLVQRGWM